MTNPLLHNLVGRVITARDETKAPGTPFRPYKTDPSTTKRLTFDAFGFSYNGYMGEWWLGWTHPCVKLGPKKRVLRLEGWAPYMAWNLRRQIAGARYTDTHYEWHQHLRLGSGIVVKLNETLDPEFGLSCAKFKYVITTGLAATFQDHLGEYFARSEVVQKIAAIQRF